MKFDPNTFGNLLLREAELIVKGDRQRQEQEFMINVYSTMNAIGLCFGGKGFKFIDPFKDENKTEKTESKKSNREELLQQLDDLKQEFR